MILSRLKLTNWRNFRNVDIKLGDRVFIVGPNAAGKSNLLDAFRFLRDIAKPDGGLQYALKRRQGLSKVRCLAARNQPDVGVEVEVRENGAGPVWTYAVHITQQQRGDRLPLLRSEVVTRDGREILRRPERADSLDEVRRSQTSLEQINANRRFRELARFFQRIQYLHLVPQIVRNPQAFQGPNGGDDPFGRSFLEQMTKTPRKTLNARLKRVEHVLKAVVPQLEDLQLVKDEMGVPHLETSYWHWRPNAAKQQEDQFSDGTLRLIGLFWALLDGDAPLLLEEPELSLHVEIVKRIPNLLSQLQRHRKRQVILTTHSWDLLSDKGVGGEETVLLTPGKEGTNAILAGDDKILALKLQHGLSVADAALPRTNPQNIEQLQLKF
jgi:predicted ATPase